MFEVAWKLIFMMETYDLALSCLSGDGAACSVSFSIGYIFLENHFGNTYVVKKQMAIAAGHGSLLVFFLLLVL